jgi:hypothetical protein
MADETVKLFEFTVRFDGVDGLYSGRIPAPSRETAELMVEMFGGTIDGELVSQTSTCPRCKEQIVEDFN